MENKSLWQLLWDYDPNGLVVTDADLRGWRDFVGPQLPPEGASRTLEVIGERVGLTPDALQAFIESAEQMAPLSANLPADVVAQAEQAMETQARLDLLTYWAETEAGM